jgi:hypothetical protein
MYGGNYTKSFWNEVEFDRLSLSNIFMRSTLIELCTHNTDWENWNLFCLIFRPERGSEGGRAIADARSHIHSEWQDEYELGQKALFLSFLSFFDSYSIYLTFLQLWEQTFGATVGEKKRRERDPEPDGRVPPPPLDDFLWKKGGLKQQWVSAFRLLLFFFCLFIQFISESLYFVCFNFMFLFKCTCLVFIPACAYAPFVHVKFCITLCLKWKCIPKKF